MWMADGGDDDVCSVRRVGNLGRLNGYLEFGLAIYYWNLDVGFVLQGKAR